MIVARELRIALLRRNARVQWIGTALVAAAVAMRFLLIGDLANLGKDGRQMFRCLFALALFRVVTRAFAVTADLISEERRNGTLGLLVLTGLSPLEIFHAKLVGSIALCAYELLGGLPFFAVPFLSGGVPAEEFLAALVVLPVVLLFCLSLGMLGSVVHSESSGSQMTARGLGLLLSAAPLAWYYVSQGSPGPGNASGGLAMRKCGCRGSEAIAVRPRIDPTRNGASAGGAGMRTRWDQ